VGWRVRKGKKSRYEVLLRIASGGMGIVYVGRKRGAVGFSRLVAIKRAHPHLHEDPSARRALLGEASHASRLHHAHVVAVQDVELIDGELLLIMDYVEGTSLSQLMRQGTKPVPRDAAVRVVLDVCAGLQAAHELKDDEGKPLDLVHRDVSPQNILVGTDGLARLTDFGIAKSAAAATAGTAEGVLKGKLGYLAPEYISGASANVRSDIYAVGVIAWELLTRKRLFERNNDAQTLKAILDGEIPKASRVAPGVPETMDDILARALASEPGDRYGSALDLANALESAARSAGLLGTHAQVGAHVRDVAGERLHERRERIATAVAGGLDDVASVGPPALRPSTTSDSVSNSSSGGHHATRAASPESIRRVVRDRRALLWFAAVPVVALTALAVFHFSGSGGAAPGAAELSNTASAQQQQAPAGDAATPARIAPPDEWTPVVPPSASTEASGSLTGVVSRVTGHLPRVTPSATSSAAVEKAPPNPYAATSK
jgi:serine/threonine protein kinase